jgi:guanylate kinase
MCLSVSHTTREKRPGEVNGVDYYFVDNITFDRMIAENRFLEFAAVFDHKYGTSLEAVEENLQKNIDVLLDIDWQGARAVRARLSAAISLFILPPSIAVLRQRLEKRGRDDAATIERRMADAKREISHHSEYDVVLINDDFDETLAKMKRLVTGGNLKSDVVPAALQGRDCV